jgi:hypothetical protein
MALKKEKNINKVAIQKKEKPGLNFAIPRNFKTAQNQGKIYFVEDKNGNVLVQMPLEQYRRIATSMIKSQQEAMIKKDLTNAFAQVEEMRTGKSEKRTLADLLNEL